MILVGSVTLALSTYPVYRGTAMAARMPTMMMTTINSTKVKPLRSKILLLLMASSLHASQDASLPSGTL
jgi:hypothetical protein